MTEIKKYAGAVDDVGAAWGDEANTTGVDDGSCGYVAGCGEANRLEMSSYGFNIPAGSTIDNVYVGFHVVGSSVWGYRSTMVLKFMKTHNGSTAYNHSKDGYIVVKTCADCENSESIDIQPVFTGAGQPITVDDLNNENFEIWIWHGAISYCLGLEFFLDATWIRVVYTEPVVKAPLGDGLTFATLHKGSCELRKLFKSRFPRLNPRIIN